MKQFAKSILNYFATFAETRFRFDKKIDYVWTDDIFTAELSVFPEFQKKLLDLLRSAQPINLTIQRGEYSVVLDEELFKSALLDALKNKFSAQHAKTYVEAASKQLAQSQKTVSGGQTSIQSVDADNGELMQQARIAGLRQFSLEFRKEAQSILLRLQNDKKTALLRDIANSSVPSTTFNPNIVEQAIYDSFQLSARNAADIDQFHKDIERSVSEGSWDLIMYDLHSTLSKLMTYIGMGACYIFLHEIHGVDSDSKVGPKYPLFFIEIEISEKNGSLRITANRGIGYVNVPAINAFAFDQILTIPRAARLSETTRYLEAAERFLQTKYDFYGPFILQYGFKSLVAPKCPRVNFRIGVQIVQGENRKLLDYSELITRIDAGQAGKFIDFVGNYVSGNTINTSDEVESEYRKRYPRKSTDAFVASIPLNLSKPQKRILTALDNPKNKIVVVDGPPGTGKSHAIAAITYWANQQNKSLVITSHKTVALDVIDRMLTDKFRSLHPKAKPAVMRISIENSGVNTYENTLSGPVIAAATNRMHDFNADAIRKDLNAWRGDIETRLSHLWRHAGEYQANIERLLRYEQLEVWLREHAIIIEAASVLKPSDSQVMNLESIRECAQKISESHVDSLTVRQLSVIHEKAELLPKAKSICNELNRASIGLSDCQRVKRTSTGARNEFSGIIATLHRALSGKSPLRTKEHWKYKLLFRFQKRRLLPALEAAYEKLKGLEYEPILSNIATFASKSEDALVLADLAPGLQRLERVERLRNDAEMLGSLFKELDIEGMGLSEIFEYLSLGERLAKTVRKETIPSLEVLDKLYGALLKKAGLDASNLKSLNILFSAAEPYNMLLEFITVSVALAKYEDAKLPSTTLVSSYYETVQKTIDHLNDQRVKNLNNHSADIERILVTLKTGKRLDEEQLSVLLKNVPCIIAEPDLIAKYFPMQEDAIDILVIDEASQVSIAESISLILRAKQIVVLGDELQYGAVSAFNVNSTYAGQYFKEILDNYQEDYHLAIDEGEKKRLADEASREVEEDDQELEPVYKPEEGTKEWLKTFSVRTSTLNFAKALKNYSVSLDTHFRSFPEVIHYSNEIFYKPSQIPLIVNRIRTKPISEVLRFVKVEAKGHAGNNINLDEIDAVKTDIQAIIANGFKGTIGVITSFREQKYRMEEILRKELDNYHILERDHKLSIWFVGDVQGEERDIVYYSFVEDKGIGNGRLTTIYPTIGGKADNIRNLKMQRLNVGFSRAKDTMVFVHSMPIASYSDTRLGDALKIYKHLRDSAVDNFVADESIFGSPAERELYNLIINTAFYNEHREHLKIIAQFPIGKYIEETLHRYIPKYRVDFLLTLSERGHEKSLILEYDGVEFHTRNPEIVTAQNISQEYLEYDIERQLELESYGYKFLRINKFSLVPKSRGQSKIDVLSELLKYKFEN